MKPLLSPIGKRVVYAISTQGGKGIDHQITKWWREAFGNQTGIICLTSVWSSTSSF
jgi:hypothetical protein